MNENNWYDVSGWYEPAETAPAVPAPVGEKKVKKGWTRARVIGLVVLLLALIIGTSLAFAMPREHAFSFVWDADGPFGDEFFSDELPEDWNDFFDSYYVDDESVINASNIPRIELEGAYNISLESKGEAELSLQQIYEQCSDSITAIYGYTDDSEGYFWGTGVVLSEDGLILTNAHVISDCDSAVVKLSDDSEYEAKLVGSDTISDLAVLKIEAEGLHPASFGDSAELKVGENVAAIGNPLSETFRSTLTNGIISAIERGISYNGHSMALIQTNAAINEGNSGGALFNMYGQVIGITNMKMTSIYSNIEGMGFAIPSSTVCSVVNSLTAYGEVRGRPSLGIVIGAVPEYAAEHYDLPEGLYVDEVVENSDAARQGMQAGDIIVEVNFEPAESAEQVNAIKNTLEVGDIMIFKVWRDGEYLEFEVALMDTNDLYN